MAGHEFSDEIVHKARHAMGLTRNKVAYRNHYSVDTPDADWEDLVERGFAVRQKTPWIPGIIYLLTKQSAFFFMEPTESLGDELKFPDALASPQRDGV